MARRRVLGAVLLVALCMAGVAGGSAGAAARTERGGSRTEPSTDSTPLVASTPPTAAAVVGERTERVSEASANDRRSSSRDGRPVDWLALGIIGAVVATALAGSLARRRRRRVATLSLHFAPSRGPPLLLAS